MTSRRYRAAVIGCGKISRGHARAYSDSPSVDLIAAADVSEQALAVFGDEFGVNARYTDTVEMLERERPDFVSICTWPPLHADQTEAAFAAGVRVVWAEKPMAVHLADADRMLSAAAAAGGFIVVNHQRRFVESYRQARQLLDDGAIGQVTHITGICAGDTLTDGTHLIDMTRFLNHDAPIASVFGAIEMSPKGDVSPDGMGTIEFNQTRRRYGHHVESGALGLLLFENGVRANLEMGKLARPGYQRFLIDGTEGRIELSGDRPFDDGTRLRIRRRTGEFEPGPPSSLDGAMERVLSETLRVLEEGGSHTLSGESGRADLEVVTAILESARRRLMLSLPIDVREYPVEAMLAAGEIPLN
ncbi:MAG TPA: Gfo/Idh/MocA family oxidoreductase [Thermomicrobiales bacterium]|jgi:predicted dehydrogenase